MRRPEALAARLGWERWRRAGVETAIDDLGAASVPAVVLAGADGSVVLIGFSALSYASPIAAVAEVVVAGAIGGAINTDTLRGTLIGAATAEAFWGVGGIKGPLG